MHIGDLIHPTAVSGSDRGPQLKRFSPRDPGEHVDGLWQYLYPKRFTTPSPQ